MSTPGQVHIQPPLLDGEMTPAEIADILERLPLQKEPQCTIALDRDVRDYLLDMLKTRERRQR